jgi:drug/metabolite transporter (DMT)-like permease
MTGDLVDRLAERCLSATLGAAFLSAVASRFGLWDGRPWPEAFSAFVALTGEVNAFMPAATVPVLAWAATAAETTLGLALVLGLRAPWVALGSAGLLAIFGTAMALSLGVKSPLDYSVFSASAGAWLLARWRRASHPQSAATPAAQEVLRLPAGVIDTALLVMPGVIWGASFLFIAEGLEAIAPDGITFLRFVIGFATLACVPRARVALRSTDHVAVAGLAVVWMALPMSLFPHAEQHVSSALTGMLNGAIPLIAAAVATLVAVRAPSRTAWTGLGLGLLGAVLMAQPSLQTGGTTATGVGLILVAVVSYGVGINLARPLQQRHGALPVVWRALAVSMLLTAPLGLPTLAHAHWSPRALVAVLALGCLGTAAANVVMAVAAGRLGAVRASATTFLIPVVALALGVLVRGERVPLLAVVGGGLCLAGAAVLRHPAALEPAPVRQPSPGAHPQAFS